MRRLGDTQTDLTQNVYFQNQTLLNLAVDVFHYQNILSVQWNATFSVESYHHWCPDFMVISTGLLI